MSSKVQRQARTQEPTDDVEKAAAEARQKRQNECNQALGSAVNELKERYGCEIQVFAVFGNTLVPIGQILSVPVTLSSVAQVK